MKKLELRWTYRALNFRKPAKTSRDTLYEKPSWFIQLRDPATHQIGIGECSLIPGLSLDTTEAVTSSLGTLEGETTLAELQPDHYSNLPALQFALETALRSLTAEDPFLLYPGPFTSSEQGIPINGLIWMASAEAMFEQIQARIAEGFRIIKMKIGALNWDEELALLEEIRAVFPPEQIELRLDANGAFSAEEARDALDELSRFSIHSIEQPIRQGQWSAMSKLCKHSAIPIALDEELIGCKEPETMLAQVQPHYLILKPSLIGGLAASERWVALAKLHGVNWWATSALESNIGLNAIAQWCAASDTDLPQGLGTGRLFTNNISSPLEVRNAELHYTRAPWDIHELFDA